MKNGRSGLLQSALLVVFGVVLILKPDLGSAAVASVLGWILILAGAVGLLISVLGRQVRRTGEILGSVLVLALGIFLVKRPLALASLLGIVLGAYLLFLGFGSLRTALQLKSRGYGFLPNLILAAGMLFFGIGLMASPLSASQLIMRLVGVAMAICGVINLLLWTGATKRLKAPDEKPEIIDAEE